MPRVPKTPKKPEATGKSKYFDPDSPYCPPSRKTRSTTRLKAQNATQPPPAEQAAPTKKSKYFDPKSPHCPPSRKTLLSTQSEDDAVTTLIQPQTPAPKSKTRGTRQAPNSRTRKPKREPEPKSKTRKCLFEHCMECESLGEHLARAKPRLIQEKVASNDWKLVVVVSLLNKTAGRHAIPVFWDLMRKYPTSKDLAKANRNELFAMIAHLGLGDKRADQLKEMSGTFNIDPPKQHRLRPSRAKIPDPNASDLPMTTTGDSRSESLHVKGKCREVPYPPTAISHLPGVGAYALDSYRIFYPELDGGGAPAGEAECLEALESAAYYQEPLGPFPALMEPLEVHAKFLGRGFRYDVPIRDHIGEPEVGPLDAWRAVRPKDKELRKYLIWRWAIEGVRFDPDENTLTPKETFMDLWELPHWDLGTHPELQAQPINS